jgi:hypothetical protein
MDSDQVFICHRVASLRAFDELGLLRRTALPRFVCVLVTPAAAARFHGALGRAGVLPGGGPTGDVASGQRHPYR